MNVVIETLPFCVWHRCCIIIPFKRWLIPLLEKSAFLVCHIKSLLT